MVGTTDGADDEALLPASLWCESLLIWPDPCACACFPSSSVPVVVCSCACSCTGWWAPSNRSPGPLPWRISVPDIEEGAGAVAGRGGLLGLARCNDIEATRRLLPTGNSSNNFAMPMFLESIIQCLVQRRGVDGEDISPCLFVYFPSGFSTLAGIRAAFLVVW